MPYFLVKVYFIVLADSSWEAEALAKDVLGHEEVETAKIGWIEGPYGSIGEAEKALQEAED